LGLNHYSRTPMLQYSKALQSLCAVYQKIEIMQLVNSKSCGMQVLFKGVEVQ